MSERVPSDSEKEIQESLRIHQKRLKEAKLAVKEAKNYIKEIQKLCPHETHFRHGYYDGHNELQYYCVCNACEKQSCGYNAFPESKVTGNTYC